MPESETSTTRDRIDRLLDRVLASPAMEGVYLSPWWPLEPSRPGGGVAGWKRSVLRREPGRGAVHWGHLLLLAEAGARPPAARSSPPVLEIPISALTAGSETLWVRARLEEPSRRFADRIREELARAGSETS